jgi:hypothetical protein
MLTELCATRSLANFERGFIWLASFDESFSHHGGAECAEEIFDQILCALSASVVKSVFFLVAAYPRGVSVLNKLRGG